MFKYQILDPVNNAVIKPSSERRNMYQDSGFKNAILYSLANDLLSKKLVDLMVSKNDMIDTTNET